MVSITFPELKEYTRKHPPPTIAVSHSNLGPSDATFILDQWAMEFISYAKALGYLVIDISGADLTYERMTDILMQTKPSVLFNFSHGCRTYLMGNDMKCTLTRGWEDQQSCGICGMPSNLNVVNGMAIIAFSCHSGAQLGKCAINYGAPMYVGFADNLIVVSDKFGTQNIFRDALMPLIYHIIEGWTVGSAVQQTKSDMIATVKQYKPVELISVPLYYNLKYLTLLGDPNWRLTSWDGW